MPSSLASIDKNYRIEIDGERAKPFSQQEKESEKVIKTILGGIILIIKLIMIGSNVAAGLLIIECEYIYIGRY